VRISKSEKIANDFLLQFAYAIAASILLLYIYNASLFKYGGNLGSAMPKILWVLFGLAAAGGIVFIVLWRLKKVNGYKIAAIYSFSTAAGFFWCVALQPFFYFLKRLNPFLENSIITSWIVSALEYLANTKRLMEMLFILIGVSLVVEIIVYLYRMKNIKKPKTKQIKKIGSVE
jgi:hypothetical protein